MYGPTIPLLSICQEKRNCMSWQGLVHQYSQNLIPNSWKVETARILTTDEQISEPWCIHASGAPWQSKMNSSEGQWRVVTQLLWVQEVVDSVVKSLDREYPVDPGEQPETQPRRGQGERPERQRLPASQVASCSAAVPAVVRTVRHPRSRCSSALSTAKRLWLKPRPWWPASWRRSGTTWPGASCVAVTKLKIQAGSKELQVKQQLDGWVTKCVDGHIHLIPTMSKEMKESLLSSGK